MPLFNNQDSYEVVREGEDNILKIDAERAEYTPSVEDSPVCMQRTIKKLMETSDITKIVFSQKRDYEYDFSQTQLLIEIAKLYGKLLKQKELFSYQALIYDPACTKCGNGWFNETQHILNDIFTSDPLGAFVETTRLTRRELIRMQKTTDNRCINCIKKFIATLRYIQNELEKTKLVELAKPYLAGYELGDREVYRRIFSPSIKPDFMFTKLMAMYPVDGEELDNYALPDETEITIFRLPDSVKTLYHMMPPEFKLEEEKYELLDQARKIMAEHKPKKSEFVDPQRMRQIFYNVGHDLIEELSNYRNVKLRAKEIDRLTEILVRYTVGFGLIEVLLQDDKIQDISINSPMGQIPMFIVHGEFDDCYTNIVPTKGEAESWASKLRMISGRPLDEANPILDTELELPGASTRVAAITEPLNPTGLAYSFRRHRDRPWSLPLFIHNKMITSTGAGLISFLVDGTRSILIAGTRSSGKTSFLSSILVEIMRRYRIITIEDTLELPTGSLRKLGFNIQSMKVASALSKGGSELTASDGIRTTLRLGDSSLIVGEVRSAEATALYEAMRVGAAANVVAGTIHGDSPYGVFDRVVNDIGVPKTSFKATDIIIVANPIKTADGLHRYRRVTQITEVGKEWNNDPHLEGGFMDLMKYDAKRDILDATDGLNNGESEVLKIIAGNVKEFAGNWDSVWDNIMLRSRLKQTQVDTAVKLNDMELLEAPMTITCNDIYHMVAEDVKNEIGTLEPKRIEYEWSEWWKKAIKDYLSKRTKAQ
ncbi:type II/IV secretion system ATPase subunit [Candidatus Woesearchaeota archaeon]|nr:type II/IV secretion system ATPase subunit [Candidatus Woesearchaeota archaeon]